LLGLLILWVDLRSFCSLLTLALATLAALWWFGALLLLLLRLQVAAQQLLLHARQRVLQLLDLRGERAHLLLQRLDLTSAAAASDAKEAAPLRL